jgi:hypothetical protein
MDLHRLTPASALDRLRGRAVLLVVALVSLAAVAVLAAPTVRWVGNLSAQPGPPVQLVAPDTTASPPPSTIPVAPAPVVAPEPSVALMPPVAPAPATAIQTVPAVRDFVVEVDGRAFSSDASGLIEIGDQGAAAVITVVGIVAVPPLEQVEFLAWSDGTRALARTVGSVRGPTVQLGVVVKDRITVAVQPPDARTSLVTFSTEGGIVVLQEGSPQWVIRSRAVADGDAVIEQDLTYTVESMTIDGSPAVVAPSTFIPSPEAIWTIQP